jgi:osomolarity two-component system response regulator SSK1
MWLEQKVTEWGCMQALIDFEGWRKWRGFADAQTNASAQAVRVSDSQIPEPSSQSGARRLGSDPKENTAAARPTKGLFGYPSASSGKASSASSSSTVIHNGAPSTSGRNSSSGSGNSGSAAAKKVQRGNPASPSPKMTTPTSLEH